LDYEGGYLWLVGSHSLKRENVASKHKDNRVEKNFKRLAKVSADGNRFLLARIPVAEDKGTYTLKRKVAVDSRQLAAARLRGDSNGNDLTAALAEDDHLRPFLAGIPGKDNGFDIEGIAVSGDRILLGLRGPVLRGWAMILEIDVKTAGDDATTLELKKVGPGGQPYRKHFVDLGGLGIRDLCAESGDLLILAGPTMDLDGPTAIYRWVGGAKPDEQSMVFREELQKVIDVPFGDGTDHAEGLALYTPEGGGDKQMLVVYDAPADARKKGSSLRTDVFALPRG
jgi:hypothetical protein